LVLPHDGEEAALAFPRRLHTRNIADQIGAVFNEPLHAAFESGQPVADVEGDANGRMLLRQSDKAPWQHFDQSTTIFAAAKRQGWGTGVAGWYNPYCRILDTVLDRCYWTYGQPVAGELFSRLSTRQSVWENARDGLPLAARLQALSGHASPNQALDEDYRNLLHAGEALIQDADIRLAFIHMPVPHPFGLAPNPGGDHAFDYLGNLELADRALAQFLHSLDTNSSGNDTVLIVSSDHSWRVPIWRGMPGWNRDEEQATNGGVFDQRPVLMVRFPKAAKAERIDRPESEMIVHNLVLDLVRGNVRTPEEWIATLPATTVSKGHAVPTTISSCGYASRVMSSSLSKSSSRRPIAIA